MEKLTPFIICVAFILISFCFWVAAIKLSSYAARKKIMAQPNSASKEATSVLLISYFGEIFVLPNICLPVHTEKGLIYVKTDNIVILPTCVAVILVENMSGQIFSADSRVWSQSVRMPDGSHKKRDFENPITINERNVIALSNIFEKEKVSSVTVRNMVLFSSDKVTFSEESPEIYSLSEAIEKMKALSKSEGESMSFKERLDLIRIIKKHSVPVSKAREHNAKILNMASTASNKTVAASKKSEKTPTKKGKKPFFFLRKKKKAVCAEENAQGRVSAVQKEYVRTTASGKKTAVLHKPTANTGVTSVAQPQKAVPKAKNEGAKAVTHQKPAPVKAHTGVHDKVPKKTAAPQNADVKNVQRKTPKMTQTSPARSASASKNSRTSP